MTLSLSTRVIFFCSIVISRALWYWLSEGPRSKIDDNANIPSRTKLKDELGLTIAIFNTKLAKDSSIMGANIRVLVSLTIPIELGSLRSQRAFKYPQYSSRCASFPERKNGERFGKRGSGKSCKYPAISTPC